MLIPVYNSHCATHQIRVILISCVVITSLFYPALDVYTSSKYSSPATFLALTYFFPTVAQNAQFPEASPIALEVCIRRDPLLTVYAHYGSIPVWSSVGGLARHLGLSLSSVYRLLCLCCLVCSTDGHRTFSTRSDVYCSRRNCCFHHHLVECLRPCRFQRNDGTMVSEVMLCYRQLNVLS